MKTRIIVSSSFIFAVATAILVLATPFGPSVQGDGRADINAFARRVAGNYLMDVDFEPLHLTALVTFGADGNFSFEDTSNFGAFSPPAPAFESAQRGAWERSGRNKVRILSIGFSYDTNGMFIGSSRHRATVKFHREFESFSLEEAFVDIFHPDADPLDDVPTISLPFAATARRIPAAIE